MSLRWYCPCFHKQTKLYNYVKILLVLVIPLPWLAYQRNSLASIQTLGVLLNSIFSVFSACIWHHLVSISSARLQPGQVRKRKHCSKSNGLQLTNKLCNCKATTRLHRVIATHSEGTHPPLVRTYHTPGERNPPKLPDSLIPQTKPINR